jgi:Fur family ferric uptake transcriptional regulator
MKRQTQQRRLIRNVLERADRPMSPREIHRLAGKAMPGLGIATVYRTIKTMQDQADLALVEIPGEPPRFELTGKPHHHHFHCRQCGRVFEVHGCPGELRRLTPRGFRLEGHELMLYGRCSNCAS